MNTKLTCPVCSRPEVEDDICPNCETNLSTMRMLAELPPSAPIQPVPIQKQLRASWLLAVAILMLVLGISLGAASYPWISAYLPSTTATVTATNPLPANTNDRQKQQHRESDLDGFRYKVRYGDSLSQIAGRFYGDIKLWSLIVKANPSLKGRENSLSVGEVLLVPNRQEDSGGNL